MAIKAGILKFWQFLTEIFALKMKKFHPESSDNIIGILLAYI